MTEPAKLMVLERIQAVMKAMPVIPKSGHNKHDNYDYASRDDIVGVVGKLMAEHGLVFTLSKVVDNTFQASYFNVSDREDVISFELDASGHHPNAAKSPQAYGSAISYAEKFAHRTMFQIETGDKDPDNESGDGPKGGRKGKTPATPKVKTTGVLNDSQVNELKAINRDLKISKAKQSKLLAACDNNIEEYFKVMLNVNDEAFTRKEATLPAMELDEMLQWCKPKAAEGGGS